MICPVNCHVLLRGVKRQNNPGQFKSLRATKPTKREHKRFRVENTKNINSFGSFFSNFFSTINLTKRWGHAMACPYGPIIGCTLGHAMAWPHINPYHVNHHFAITDEFAFYKVKV